MNKKFIKIVAVLTALSLISGSSAFAADNNNSFGLNTEVENSQTAFEKENEANEAYTNMLESFRNSTTSPLSIQSEDTEALQSGYTVDGIPADSFPDYYAGAYINENHELVVLVTDNVASTRRMAKAQSQESNLNFREVAHSYADLVRCMDEITSHWDNGDTAFADLKYAYIDDYGNRIVVGSRRIDDEYMSFLQSELEYFDLIEFCECGDVDEVRLESININCQTKLQKANSSAPTELTNPFSFGFKASKYINGVKKYGFVTAAHAASVGQYVGYARTYSNYDCIGRSVYSRQNDKVDAAFIEVTNNEYIPSGQFQNRTTSTTVSSLAQGSTVYKYGYKTNEQSGKVVTTSFTMNVGLTIYYSDYVLTNYYSEPGDSGGLVYKLSGNIAYPVGIHIMSLSKETVIKFIPEPSIQPVDGAYRGYCKIGNILNDLGVTIEN